jgi:hypothetical protein
VFQKFEALIFQDMWHMNANEIIIIIIIMKLVRLSPYAFTTNSTPPQGNIPGTHFS